MTVSVGISSYAPSPFPRSIESVRRRLLNTSFTSSFQCWFNPPAPVIAFMQETHPGRLGTIASSTDTVDYLALSCNETSLPGSSFATHESNNDYTGVSQKYAYRRLYDDRIDFTFYVRNDYLEIMFFENWMACIANEQYTATGGGRGLREPDYNYRFNYADSYKGTVYIDKFEKDYGRTNDNFLYNTPSDRPYLRYTLFDAFPISMNSTPVSYEASNTLKLTVSFSFSRYVVERYDYDISGTVVGAVNSSPGIVSVDFLVDGQVITRNMPSTVYNTNFAPSVP